jgi:FO synthase
VRDGQRWVAPRLRAGVLAGVDADGWPCRDGWAAGAPGPLPEADSALVTAPFFGRSHLAPILDKAVAGETLDEAGIAALFRARGSDVTAICAAADDLRRQANGDLATYVVTRNINYTNICSYRCQFCAFSKGKTAEHLRGRPYDLPLAEIADQAREAWTRGATEVCMQGGIHPDYTGDTYLAILRAVKAAAPGIHVHAFSPLEVHHGATTLGLSLPEYLTALKEAGLGSLPGTAAEILDEEVRAVLCPDKLDTQRWLEVMRAAHGVGLRSTATIMFGHVDRYEHWARHLLHLRRLQAETGGLTEMVPLPFVHMEAPIYLKGRARRGPSFREAVLMHAVGRLALHPHVRNIQASWVKMGPDGMGLCLKAGANDMGGTLMAESITRSAGASHGQEMTSEHLEAVARAAGRIPRQRTTLYDDAPEDRRRAAAARAG